MDNGVKLEISIDWTFKDLGISGIKIKYYFLKLLILI